MSIFLKKEKLPYINYNLKEILNLIDVYTISILLLYSLFAIVFFKIIVDAKSYLFINLLIISSIVTFATIVEKFNAGQLFVFVRNLYILPVVFYIYTQTQIYISIFNPHDYDNLMIEIDRFLFGVNPTEYLYQFANPWLTELLQFSYMLFFVMPLLVGFELYFKGDHRKYVDFTRTIAFAFFVSYLLYFFLPAVGPRFTLHDFDSINIELPGLLFTDFFRDIVNIGGGIYPEVPMSLYHRDCMPSGHTMVTIVNIWLAFRYKSVSRWGICFFGTCLIFGTVYLRYHYVIDVIAGLLFGVSVMYLEPKLRHWLSKKGFRLA